MFGSLNRFFQKWRKKKYQDIDPDLIFIDSKNLPRFDLYQFEGRLEKSISPRVFSSLTFLFICLALIFIFRIVSLQIVNGAEYRERSENNKLKQILIIAPRGIIYSRNGEKLAWNQKQDNSIETPGDFPLRKYIEKNGFGNLLGFVKYPAKDKMGFYYQEEFLPKDGAELYFNEILMGHNGFKLVETNVSGAVVSESMTEPPKIGQDVTLSIDSRIQEKLYNIIEELSLRVGFQGGAGILMDVHSGEILAMTSFPEYKSAVMTEGKDSALIGNYFNNPQNPFLNRVVSGLYTPGSIIKPFLAFAALEEKIISPEKEIISTGRLVVPNPYNPDSPTIFKDWKAHGATDMRKAIAVSSDTYFYQIGGGFENQKGLGIYNIKKYMEKFGFNKKTGFDPVKEEAGIIPTPEWKAEMFDGDIWRIGDTYNTSIGQYGMKVTPIQAVVATASLANDGKLLMPSLYFTGTSTVSLGKKVDGAEANFKIVKEGMRLAVTEGTARGLNIPGLAVAAKTGTAELGARKQFVNSWVIGFFPYENPKYAFTVVMERGPVTNLTGGTYVMRQLLDWMLVNTPEYIKN